MSWLETIRTGINGVRSHRLRSALTVLGILIGIAGVIIAVGLGEGASSQVTSEINSLGSNVLTITPGSSTSSSGIREALGSASTLTMADVAALQSPVDAPDVKEVAPITSQTEVLTAGSETATTSVQGTTPTWLSVRSRTLAEGRFVDNQDLKDHTAVGVLGATTASELFPRGDPVGQTVDVNGVPVTVVGVLTSTGSSSSSSSTSDPDDTLIIPISTGAERIFGGTSRSSVSSIAVQARSSADLTARLPGGGPPAAPAPRDHEFVGRGLYDHLRTVADRSQHVCRPHAHHPARRYRGHLPHRRGDRRHEHHVGVGHRAHP